MDRATELAALVNEQRRDDTSHVNRERIGGDFTLSLDRLVSDGFDVTTDEENDVPPDANRVRAAIDRLPEAQRDVINGLFYERVTEAALAERMGVSRALVRKRREQALSTLSAILGVDFAATA